MNLQVGRGISSDLFQLFIFIVPTKTRYYDTLRGLESQAAFRGTHQPRSAAGGVPDSSYGVHCTLLHLKTAASVQKFVE